MWKDTKTVKMRRRLQKKKKLLVTADDAKSEGTSKQRAG